MDVKKTGQTAPSKFYCEQILKDNPFPKSPWKLESPNSEESKTTRHFVSIIAYHFDWFDKMNFAGFNCLIKVIWL